MITWENIRPLKGSQHNAFEELVCQLARVEFTKIGKFTRIAAPDGGVEAICELEDGSLWGWQAKYFLHSFDNSQWQQIEQSFKDALSNYPKLVKFFVCSPIDRNNPFIKGRQSFLTKWNSHVKQWKEYATSLKRNVEIEFWGSSELSELLSKSENSGKTYYWFGKDELSEQWFQQYSQQAISNLGVRYTPEINIDLPISIYFEALSRSKLFISKFRSKFHELLVNIQKHNHKVIQNNELASFFENTLMQLKQGLNLEKYKLNNNFPIDDLSGLINSLIINLNERIDYKNIDEKKEYIHYEIRTLISLFEELDEIINSEEMKLFNGNVLWLLGDAGVGKSHLLGDITSQRTKQGKPSLLLLGQDFIEVSNVWEQILNKQLNLTINPREFLSALDSIAESQNERILLSIDALNEGVGRELWNNQLNGFIDLLRNYPNIGLVLSVRTTYQEVIQQSLTQEIKNNICTIRHYGFSDMEFEAIQSFFQYYNLILPSTPLLNPEFSNPLYLKLLCESLIKQGLSTISKGHKGINQIISIYIQGVEKSISRQLDEDEGLHLVQRAIHVVAQLSLYEESLEYISVRRAIAKELEDDISESNAKKFIDYLIKEGVFLKNIYYSGEKEIVYFAYERVGDYQKANLILDNISSKDNLQNWLASKDGNYIFEKPNIYRGLIEALAVLVPEKLSCELFDVLHFKNQYKQELLAEIILNSLIWRSDTLINVENIIQFIKDNLSKYNYALWVDTMYQLSSEPNHPFNILYIHKYLNALSLADRDEKWTAFISVDRNECPAIQRLLLWCCKYSQTSKVETKSRLLSAIAVSWLLGSTNIKQRNEAMTSLASLLLDHINIGHQLYIHFADINDPYVLDGVLYSIYHAILCSENLNGLRELALEIYQQIFDISSDKEIYPNVLVRDSAHNIIKFALVNLGDVYSESEKVNIQSKITPPYRSDFPDQLPSTNLIDKKYTSKNQKVIIHSMTTEYGRGMCAYGDFGRYTFQSTLRKWERHHEEKQLIDIDLLSNYACELIFEKFGYNDKKHGFFDNRNRSYYRGDNKIERIGKKYQWLALYEILARVMDNIQAPEEHYSKNSPLQWVTNLNDFHLPKANIAITSFSLKDNWDEYSSQIPDIDSDKYCSGEISEWINDTENLPNIPDMIEIEINGELWIVLERHDNLENSPEFGEEEHI